MKTITSKDIRSKFKNKVMPLKKIKLIDKCLIIFMFILMCQSIFSLFAHEANSQETTPIDTMIRTASASIFGYFLSANFIKRASPKPGNTPKDASTTVAKLEEIQEELEAVLEVEKEKEEEEEAETSNQQIIIATIIGITALCVLLIARNFLTITPATLGTISQMRDFVSGCIGFLLGCPTTFKSNR